MAEEQCEKQVLKRNMLHNVKLLVAHLKKNIKRMAKGGTGKERRKLLPENWEVKEIGGECLAVVNLLNCTSNSKQGRPRRSLPKQWWDKGRGPPGGRDR